MATPAIKTIPRGASIYSFEVDGQEILLHFPDPALHSKLPHPFFGETIGRVANRIENATLANLNGKTYHLDRNDDPNTLHGGTKGWGKVDWIGPSYARKGSWDAGISAVAPEGWREPGGGGREGVKYEYLSPDGDEGFPGAVKATVWYFEGRDKDGKVVLDSEYEAVLTGETEGVEETVVSMTNHSYFNLNPRSADKSPTLEHHTLTLASAIHQKMSDANPGIPDGTFTPHAHVPFPHKPFPIFDAETRAAVPIDECFVLSPQTSPAEVALDTRPGDLRLLGELRSSASGIMLRVESTEPAFQCYTGRFIDVPAWAAGEVEGRRYGAGPGFTINAGMCLEAGRLVNAAGKEEWRAMVLLKKGDTYGARTRYTAGRA